MWTETPENGLNKLNRENGTFTHYYVKDGLPQRPPCSLPLSNGASPAQKIDPTGEVKVKSRNCEQAYLTAKTGGLYSCCALLGVA